MKNNLWMLQDEVPSQLQFPFPSLHPVPPSNPVCVNDLVRSLCLGASFFSSKYNARYIYVIRSETFTSSYSVKHAGYSQAMASVDIFFLL